VSSARAVLAGRAQTSRCGRCGEVKPRTPEHFYFRPNGDRTGFCKPCQKAWWTAYWPQVTAYQRERRRRQQRDWWRANRGKASNQPKEQAMGNPTRAGAARRRGGVA
jgi:hypothetical protein